MKKVVILGTGGNCLDILEILHDCNASSPIYECVGFLEDSFERHGQAVLGVPVLGPLAMAQELDGCWFVNGIGSAANFWRKEAILETTGLRDDRFATVVHPSAVVARTAEVGRGSILFPNVVVCSRARIGSQTLVLANCVINHDVDVGSFGTIASGVCISGGVRIGKGCYLGTQAAIRDGVSIGDNCLVGMGSVVIRDVPDATVVIGNPARFQRSIALTGDA